MTQEANRLLRPHSWRRIACTVLLCLFAAPALALGLGQIQVKSKPGEPLLAEIPIVSSDPAELQGLQARLASPETFRRIGLDPPQGIVSDLQFTPAVDERGRPVIRVTSRAPVQQAGLTFLVEVDWGQGRLVREYSALVDAPRTVAAPVAPPVQAPDTAPLPVIQRPAQAVPVPPTPSSPPVAVAPPPPQPVAPSSPPPTPAPSPPAPAAVTTPPAPVPAATAPPPAPSPARPAGYPVKRGDTLAQIAGQLPGTEGYSLDQTMLALLHANPDAFIGQDINRLREGAVLRAPAQDELQRYSAGQAAQMVREQVANWRQARSAQAQPVAETASADAASSRARAGQTAPTATPPTRRTAQARLEIAPPQAAAGTRAGTQSGASVGGEGQMLRQELQQTKETLAARDAEVAELKTRVAELERLQQEQQRLISMKDNALAGAQQRLASAKTPPPAAATVPAAAPATAQSDATDTSPWTWLIPLALLLAGLAWWLLRRRRSPETTAVRASTATPAASAPSASDAVPASPSASAAAPQVVLPEAESPVVAPAWAGRAARPAPLAPKAPASATTTTTPTWMSGAAPDASTVASLNSAPAGSERIELARAYADLGDRVTARTLLQEVIDGGDVDARTEAARVLQSLD